MSALICVKNIFLMSTLKAAQTLPDPNSHLFVRNVGRSIKTEFIVSEICLCRMFSCFFASSFNVHALGRLKNKLGSEIS